MRLSQKLATTDDKVAQLTLRIKKPALDQLKADVENTDRSVNELAALLIETAIALPGWTQVAAAFFQSLERPAFLLIAGELAREINQAADENVDVCFRTETVKAEKLSLQSPVPMKVGELTSNGSDVTVDFVGEIFAEITGRHESLSMKFVARFNLHAPALMQSSSDEPSLLRAKNPVPAGLCFTGFREIECRVGL